MSADTNKGLGQLRSADRSRSPWLPLDALLSCLAIIATVPRALAMLN